MYSFIQIKMNIFVGNCVIIIDEMARLEAQESAEYYKWLLRIEHIEFEKELLEIVSTFFFFLNISTIEISIPDINFDIPTPWTHFGMRFNL